MYSPISLIDNKTDYKSLRYDSRKKPNNFKILDEINVNNKLCIEIEFTKNNALFIKKIFIHRNNIDKITKKLVNNGFVCASKVRDIDFVSNTCKTRCNTRVVISCSPRRLRRSLGAFGAASRRLRRRFFSSLFFLEVWKHQIAAFFAES